MEELQHYILDREGPFLPGIIDEEKVAFQAEIRARTIRGYLDDRMDRTYSACLLDCGRSARKSETRWVHDTPWEDEETEKHFCSEEHADIYLYEPDFAYRWCEPCGREICEQNPKQGWHWQFKDYDGEEFCLRCYEETVLEHGQPEDDFEGLRIKGGMFFSYGNPEPKAEGWEEAGTHFIRSGEDAEVYNMKARKYIEQGYKVITGYERLAIGGLEGTVTMMIKKDVEE